MTITLLSEEGIIGWPLESPVIPNGLQANCNFHGAGALSLTIVAPHPVAIISNHNLHTTEVQGCIHSNAVEIAQTVKKE